MQSRVRQFAIPKLLSICVAVLAVALGVIWTTQLWKYVFRPERPMFCNEFSMPELGWLPEWRKSLPLNDEHGNEMWIDVDDNLIVLVQRPSDEPFRSAPILIGGSHTHFKIGRDDTNSYVTINRVQNTL